MSARRLNRPLVTGLVLVGLLATGLWPALRTLWRREVPVDSRPVVRIGHYLLHPGLREALQEAIADYEARRPDVRIEQVPVPDRAYPQFLRTQLLGGTAPDLLQLGAHFTGIDEIRARHFLPLTPWVEEPNPWNEGTPLAGMRWRDTFVDGLDNAESWSDALRHYYGVPLTVSTVRIVANRHLLRAVTGREETPRTFEELLALGEATQRFARARGRPLAPFAGGRLPALFLMSPVFGAVTQRLGYELAADHSLRTVDWDYGVAYLQGRWDFDHPSVRRGYALVRDLARHQKPGFFQLGTGDAVLQFLQQESLLLVSMTTDLSSLIAQASFPLAVFPVPVPAPDPTDPANGAMGPVTELGHRGLANFGLTRDAPEREAALDFLRFLTSHGTMTRFTARSHWLPAVVDVPVPAGMEPLRPVTAGHPGRFFAEFAGRGDTRFVVSNQLHLLFNPQGGVAAYLDAIRPRYGPSIRTDLEREAREAARNLRRQEPALVAHHLTADPAWADDIAGQNAHEARWLRLRLILQQTAATSPQP